MPGLFWCSTAADSMHHGCFPQSYNEEHQHHGQVPSCLGAIFSFSHHTHTVKNVMLKIPILAPIQRSLSTWKYIHSLLYSFLWVKWFECCSSSKSSFFLRIENHANWSANTTLQSKMNAKLSKQRFWHCYETGLFKIIKMIPHNL